GISGPPDAGALRLAAARRACAVWTYRAKTTSEEALAVIVGAPIDQVGKCDAFHEPRRSIGGRGAEPDVQRGRDPARDRHRRVGQARRKTQFDRKAADTIVFVAYRPKEKPGSPVTGVRSR